MSIMVCWDVQNVVYISHLSHSSYLSILFNPP
jgi:hypothetical protein